MSEPPPPLKSPVPMACQLRAGLGLNGPPPYLQVMAASQPYFSLAKVLLSAQVLLRAAVIWRTSVWWSEHSHEHRERHTIALRPPWRRLRYFQRGRRFHRPHHDRPSLEQQSAGRRGPSPGRKGGVQVPG